MGNISLFFVVLGTCWIIRRDLIFLFLFPFERIYHIFSPYLCLIR